jgi:hypothetical protein
MSNIKYIFQNNESKICLYEDKFEIILKKKIFNDEIIYNINGTYAHSLNNYILGNIIKINNIKTKILIDIFFVNHQDFNCAIYVSDYYNVHIPMNLLFDINYINNIKMKYIQ